MVRGQRNEPTTAPLEYACYVTTLPCNQRHAQAYGHSNAFLPCRAAQDYYCESLGQMFIINTPTIFRLVWAVVNPLLEERTRRKIAILGSDYLPTITQLIPLENLPECLGGTSKAPVSGGRPTGNGCTAPCPLTLWHECIGPRHAAWSWGGGRRPGPAP